MLMTEGLTKAFAPTLWSEVLNQCCLPPDAPTCWQHGLHLLAQPSFDKAIAIVTCELNIKALHTLSNWLWNGNCTD